MTYRLSRQELYDLVWSEPMVTVKARFGVSDVAIAKHCRRHNIPVPPRGYWARVQAGQQIKKTPLPERGLGMPIVIEFGGNKYFRLQEPSDLINAEIPPPPVFSESLDALTERVRRRVGKVTIPKMSERAHTLIAKLLDDDNARRAKQLTAQYVSYFDQPRFESPFEQRRLRILNAIFLALARSDTSPSLNGKAMEEFTGRVGEQWVQFTLDHPKKRQGYSRPADIDRSASSKMKLEISHRSTTDGIPCAWEDGDHKIERSVQEIVVSIIVLGEMNFREGEQSQYDWLVKRKAQLIAEAKKRREEEERRRQERRIAAEKARVDRLLGEAEAFRRAADIRRYVETVRHANSASKEPVAREELEAWESWALEQADRLDPVKSKRFLLRPPDDSED